MSRDVDCPTCSKKVRWGPESPFRPFCSERCRLVDLGDWAANRHVIPGSSNDVTEEGAPDQDAAHQTPSGERSARH